MATMGLVSTSARQRTVDEAAVVATRFRAVHNFVNRVQANSAQQPTLVYTRTDGDTPLYYVFNRAGSGYIIIAADDKAQTVLAYSNTQPFTSIDDVPDNMRAWLDNYARQIRAAIDSPLAQAPRRAQRQPISPLLTTTWGQENPYNLDCPVVGTENQRTVTGCVATAMAQVMYYHRTPARPTGGVSYQWTRPDKVDANNESVKETVTRDYSSHTYDWDNMLPFYTDAAGNLLSNVTDEQRQAVSLLMADAAYSVGMQFRTGSSGAATSDVPYALATFFGFDKCADFENRYFHNDEDWEQLIYDELTARRPVIYCGTTAMGYGHTWIVDGVDSEGLFHINWGWGGFQDGYFAMTGTNTFRPAVGGIGGSSMEENYDLDQAALFNVKPNAGGEPEYDIVSVNAEQLNITSATRPIPAASDENAWFVIYGRFMNHSTGGLLNCYCDFGIKVRNHDTGFEHVFRSPFRYSDLFTFQTYIEAIGVFRTDLNCLQSGVYDVNAVYRAAPVPFGSEQNEFIEEDSWKEFRHPYDKIPANTITLTGDYPDKFVSSPLTVVSTAADHLTLKIGIAANRNIDGYLVPMIFEPAAFDANGNPTSITANPSKQTTTSTHVKLNAGQKQVVDLGVWTYQTNGSDLPKLIIQLAWSDTEDGRWTADTRLEPLAQNQVYFQATAPTAINDIVTTPSTPVGTYTLDGRRVDVNSKTQTPAKPGLYIIGGKKVLVK